MPAQINYAILSSHRSGSSLLCNLLSQTEVAGKPGEYFSHWNNTAFKNYNLSDYPAYIHRITGEMKTANDVFGVKAMPGVDDGFQGLLKRLEAFPKYKTLANPEKVRIFFPNIKFIYLTRRNKVAQAISWWKAAQNNHYHSTDSQSMPDTELEYNFDAITHLLKEIMSEESAHQAFLSMMKAIPLTLVYEDFVQDMRGTVQKILDFLGIEDEYTFNEPTLYKMADSTTEAWLQRYREELQDGWQHRRW